MPPPPAGEDDLRALATRFANAERRIRALIAAAPDGDRRDLLREALELLVALRQHLADGAAGAAVQAAYVAARGGGGRAVDDLARSLHLKLDRGARTASGSAREAITTATADNLDEAV